MAKFTIPNEEGQIRQLGYNDTEGELWCTFNTDLHTNPGKIKLARPLKRVATATQIGDNLVQGFAHQTTASQVNEAYAITEQNIYKASSPFTSWASESNGPSRAEDVTVFQGQIVISSQSNIDAYDFSSTYTTGWWTARGNPSLTSNNPISTVPRVLEVARIGAEKLVVLDGSDVHFYEGGISSGVIDSGTVQLDSSMTASCFKSGIRSGWIGTYTRSAPEAYVYQWDVSSDVYTQSFPTGAKSVLAMEMIDDVPLIITETGEIKLFNNVGFSTVAWFPFYGKATFTDQSTNPNNVNRPIHPKGIRRHGDIVYIQTNWRRSDNDGLLDEQTPNGIWAFNIRTKSLTHLCSQDNTQLFGNQGASPLMILNDSAARIFVGGEMERASDEEGIWIEDLNDATSNYSYFVTTEIESESVLDALDKAYIKALLDTDDEIIVKYRYKREVDYPITLTDATWDGVTENQFTSTNTDMALVKTRFEAGGRDEIEVLLGQGAGRLAHITNVTENAGTYTVTIDELLGIDGQTATIRIDNWKKIPISMIQSDGELKRFGAGGESATWHQFKVELRGKAGRPEIRQFASKSNNKETF